MSGREREWTRGFAIVRVDPYRLSDTDSAGPGIPCGDYSITIKEVVLDLEVARREVERLNALNADKGCRYFWQDTHLFLEGGSHGERTP